LVCALRGGRARCEADAEADAEQLSGPAQQLPAETATQIEKDLDRTFAHHAFFRSPAGLAALRATLAAYAARNPVVGYCQSLNFIAATLLLQSSGEPTTAFFTLCGLLEKRLPPDYYTRSLFGAHVSHRARRVTAPQSLTCSPPLARSSTRSCSNASLTDACRGWLRGCATTTWT
jgi:hypothetical protein